MYFLWSQNLQYLPKKSPFPVFNTVRLNYYYFDMWNNTTQYRCNVIPDNIK